MNAERLSVTKKCCLNCKEFPTYGSVCSPFDVDQSEFSCSGHLFDREDLLRRATAIEAENAELRAQLEAQRGGESLVGHLCMVSNTGGEEWVGRVIRWYEPGSPTPYVSEIRHIAGRDAGNEERWRFARLPQKEATEHGFRDCAQRGGAVVVAELTDADPAWQDVAFRADGPVAIKMFVEGHALAISRIQPIPASQVLQPGEVRVDRKTLEDASELLEKWKPNDECYGCDPADLWMCDGCRGRRAVVSIRIALRSQAGGA